MSIKDYNSVVFVTDATTGDIITVIRTNLFTLATINSMISDIFEEDYCSNKHGILIKFGIEP